MTQANPVINANKDLTSHNARFLKDYLDLLLGSQTYQELGAGLTGAKDVSEMTSIDAAKEEILTLDTSFIVGDDTPIHMQFQAYALDITYQAKDGSKKSDKVYVLKEFSAIEGGDNTKFFWKDGKKDKAYFTYKTVHLNGYKSSFANRPAFSIDVNGKPDMKLLGLGTKTATTSTGAKVKIAVAGFILKPAP